MNTIRIRVYKAKNLSSWSAFRNQETGREYSRLFPKANSKSEFSAEWCNDAQLAIQAENSRLLRETGRCSWTIEALIYIILGVSLAMILTHLGITDICDECFVR